MQDIVDVSQEGTVAICTERVEAKQGDPEQEVRKLVAICTERVEAKTPLLIISLPDLRCNLHGACGGKVSVQGHNGNLSSVAICTERVEAKSITSG